MKLGKKGRGVLCLLFCALILFGGLPGAKAGGIQLDWDPENGYEGDLVLIMNPDYFGGQRRSTGFFKQLIETDLPQFEVAQPVPEVDHSPYKTEAYDKKDPFAEELLKKDEKEGADAAWGIGHQKVFHLLLADLRGALDLQVAFTVMALGEFCRVWTPLNPDFIPINQEQASQMAQEFDTVYPPMRRVFGEALDLRGDGKVNLLFYDIKAPYVGGYFTVYDLFDTVVVDNKEFPSNGLPILHLDTFGLSGIQWVGADGTWKQDFESAYYTMAHELQHLITASFLYHDPLWKAHVVSPTGEAEVLRTSHLSQWVTEFLSAASTVVFYPQDLLNVFLPMRYAPDATLKDLENNFGEKTMVQGNPNYLTQRGMSVFEWGRNPLAYSDMAMLALFTYTRGGEGVFSTIIDLWMNQRKQLGFKEPVEAIAYALGYADFTQFVMDYQLALCLDDPDLEGGRYALFPNKGEGEMQEVAQKARRLMRPQVNSSSEIKVYPGGYTLIKPLDGHYVPPKTAMEGLVYVGIRFTPAD